MVNVAGRSKGCSTCRKKRVKCDENRPICRRCLNRGLECDVAKEVSFIQAKIVKSRRKIDKQVVVLSPPSPINSDSSPSLSPSPKPNTDLELYVCFAVTNLLRGGLVHDTLQQRQLDDITSAATTGSVFHQAVLSLSVLYWGTHHHDLSITSRGYSLHGSTLSRLNSILSLPDCYTQDSVLLSVITLSLLEAFVPTGPNHFLKHMIGLERLLELRGPSFNGSERLVRGARHIILFAALSTGKASILAREEWKRALRRYCPEEEEREQDLIDVLADCTVLVSQPPNQDIAEKALGLLSSLQKWKVEWDNDERNTRLETLVPMTQDPPFTSIYTFLNESSATTFMFYNAVLIYVFRLLSSLSPNHLLTLNLEQYQRQPALEILRSVSWYLIRKAGLDLCHSPVVHMAVITAWSTLGGMGSREGKWMMDILNKESREVIARGLWVG